MGTVVTGGDMKSIALVGLLSLLLIITYDALTGAPAKSAGVLGQAVPGAALAVMAHSGELPANLCEYVFLHQARQESLAFHAMAGVTACH